MRCNHRATLRKCLMEMMDPSSGAPHGRSLNAFCKKFRQSGRYSLSDRSGDPRRQGNGRQGGCSRFPDLAQDRPDGSPKCQEVDTPRTTCGRLGGQRCVPRTEVGSSLYVRKTEATGGHCRRLCLSSRTDASLLLYPLPQIDRRLAALENTKTAPTSRGGLKVTEKVVPLGHSQGPDRQHRPAGPRVGPDQLTTSPRPTPNPLIEPLRRQPASDRSEPKQAKSEQPQRPRLRHASRHPGRARGAPTKQDHGREVALDGPVIEKVPDVELA